MLTIAILASPLVSGLILRIRRHYVPGSGFDVLVLLLLDTETPQKGVNE
jgi:hypothetical protein